MDGTGQADSDHICHTYPLDTEHTHTHTITHTFRNHIKSTLERITTENRR